MDDSFEYFYRLKRENKMKREMIICDSQECLYAQTSKEEHARSVSMAVRNVVSVFDELPALNHYKYRADLRYMNHQSRRKIWDDFIKAPDDAAMDLACVRAENRVTNFLNQYYGHNPF
uniref:hypothetical protein n=1 Tax=Hydrocytium acuminatum TaxID=1745963 RepID=UPI002A832FD7|nr:hypothetical protein UYM18_pgp096 [Hydrocytium acuminatum]WOR09523.1 hypothetical protein [Hydrocytium acuminatum]